MLPIPSLGGRAALTVLIALAPALVAWLADRRLLARHDDPALPELIASRRRANIRAIGVAIGVMLVLGGADAAWGIPLLIAALAAAAYPVRTRLLGETWGFGRYLWYSGLSFIGGFGFWIALSYAPILVQQSIDALEAGRWPWIVVAAAAVAAVLLAWEHWYPRLWLWTHDARPLVDPVLTPRFAEVVRRAGTVAPAVYRVGPQGSRFVNAMALPSVTRPAVAMGDALLDLLDADEATAIFAHEVAHFDHFTPRRVRRSQLINRLLIVAGVTLPLVGALRGGGWTEWIGWVWPLIVLGALLQRAARSQQHETESDLRAAQLCGDPEALVRGLMTLHVHARIPRRYAVDVERAASHPSLVRRIQAIRGASGDATAAEQLGSAAVVRSTRPGSWAVLDEVRSYWLDGVPEGTSNELTSLRDAASSYRAVNYSDLVELRVDVTGDARTLRARTRMGDVWNVPIAREDVARVQLTLDVVDLRLGKAGPGPTAGTPKLIAIVMAAVAIIAGQAGIVLVPIALALWKAGPAVMAAMGAMSIARAILGLFEGPVWLDEGVMRLGLLGLMAIGIGALYVAYRMARAGDAHAHFRLTMGVLLTLTGLVALALVWRTTRFSVPIVGAPLLGTLATAVVGVVAALSTTHTGRSRPLAFTGLVAAVALATVSIDRTAWRLRRALAETAARATPESETEVGLAAHALRSSPNGAYFMVTRTSGRRRSSTVVLFGRVGGEVRELPAVAGEFVDDSRILLLDALERGFELRLEHVDSVGRATWVDTLSQIDVIEPRLLIDRDSNSWSVAGEDADTDLTVLIAGPIGQRGLARRIALPDTLAAIGGPIVFGRASTVMIPAYGQNMADEAVPFAPLSMLGGDLFRTVIWRVDGDRQTRVASFRGFPRCGEALGGAVACAATHLRATSLYTLDSNGVAVEIAQLPTEDVGVVTLGPGARVASMRFDRTIADIDLVARRLTRIALPPNTEFASEVRAGPGFVLTLGYGENRRAKVRKYRVDQAAAGPPSN